MLQQLPLLLQSNQHIQKEELQKMFPQMIKKGYRMIGVFDDKQCVGISGFGLVIKFGVENLLSQIMLWLMKITDQKELEK